MNLWNNNNAFSNLVPMVLAIIIAFAILFIGAYITGTIDQELTDSFGTTGNGTAETRAMSTMNNTSTNWDSTISIVQVVIIITILASAIGAIFLFTRFGR